MPNDLPLLPPKNQHKHLDKTMISLPSDFRHLAHVSPMGASEIENLRNSENVIDAVNEGSYYVKPSSSNGTIRSQKKERVGLDDAFPAPNQDDASNVRGYENQPTSHQYINVAPPRPSRKNYKAPPPPTPPPKDTKPNLIPDAEASDPPVVFRSISKSSHVSEPLPSPKIHTPERIEAPKPYSVVIERPGDLGGAFSFGLDDCIPIMKNTSPLKTLSPLHRTLAIPRPNVETPILSPSSPPNYQDGNYMSTIRSTSAQGKKILDELDDWLDDLDDDDREQLSTISTDESGYPTLAHEKDRAFMKHLVEKYELGVEPETVRLRRKKGPAPRLPPEALSSPTFQAPSIPPFSASRPVSMPPNRPPPSYDAPSFDAPVYEPSGLINGRNLTKQNALDLRSSDEGVSPVMARFLFDKRIKSATMPMSIGRMTTSSGFTDLSTTSTRSDAVSSALSALDEDPVEVLKRNEEIEEQFPPVPKPRTRKTVSTEPTMIEEGVEEEEMKRENVIGEEFEVIETSMVVDSEIENELKVTRKMEKEEEVEMKKKEEKISHLQITEVPSDFESEIDVHDELIVTRF
ncbi:hypothetical protein CRE_04749 [Caenorhabditis remanei]|uniref:CRIB domain-containing protein n=1 Tax=Caenorhabditis remanei TaxID=31234 RepID=E3LZ17_CAERE|nr:hypothetical protein CRE_04749 [Caenorhabditis remanei]